MKNDQTFIISSEKWLINIIGSDRSSKSQLIQEKISETGRYKHNDKTKMLIETLNSTVSQVIQTHRVPEVMLDERNK